MPTVTLSAMTSDEFQTWRLHSVQADGQDKVTAGAWTADEAEQRSMEEFDELLPDGLASESRLLFSAQEEGGEPVGILWLSLVHPRGTPDTAFGYDLEIVPERRNLG